MNKEENSDISQLKTDVALLKQFNTKVVEPTLKDIQSTLRSFSFITEEEFIEYKQDVDKRFKALRQKSWKENTLSAVFGSMLTAILFFIMNYLLKINH